MFAVLLTLFIIVCIGLMIVVLMQSSKGGGLAGSFGGGGSDSSVLGGRGAATLLSKITVYLAGAFMFLALVLAVMSSRVQVDEADSIMARQRNEGGMDVYNVEDGASILNEIQTEGFDSEEGGEETTSGDATETPAEDN
jgi:preprotein translocase subunit SecG